MSLTEQNAWRDVRDLVDLPDDLATMLDRLHRLESDPPATAPDPKPAAHHLLQGADDPAAAAASDRRAAAQAAEQNAATASAVRSLRRTAGQWVQDNRDLLIVDVLRPAADSLLDTAAPHAVTLDGYGPDFDERLLLRQGNDDQVAAWRASRDLGVDFTRLLDCWLTSFKSATSTAGGQQINGALRPGAPGGLHAWTDPLAVDDVDVRDGVNRDVLAVCKWREAGGWRLASPTELEELTDGIEVEHPWVPGERMPRRVLLPKPPKKPKYPTWAGAERTVSPRGQQRPSRL